MRGLDYTEQGVITETLPDLMGDEDGPLHEWVVGLPGLKAGIGVHGEISIRCRVPNLLLHICPAENVERLIVDLRAAAQLDVALDAPPDAVPSRT